MIIYVWHIIYDGELTRVQAEISRSGHGKFKNNFDVDLFALRLPPTRGIIYYICIDVHNIIEYIFFIRRRPNV